MKKYKRVPTTHSTVSSINTSTRNHKHMFRLKPDIPLNDYEMMSFLIKDIADLHSANVRQTDI